MLALTTTGLVFAWGSNVLGQLGVGKRKKKKKKQREADKKEIVEPLLVNLPLCSSIYSGETHSGAVTMGGDLYMWGSNDVGQLGLGERSTPKITPLFVRSLENYFCQNVSMGCVSLSLFFLRSLLSFFALFLRSLFLT